MTSGLAVRTDGLTKRFGKRAAVQDLDLSVHRGSIFGYLGPNGAGKTTTIKLLAGLYRPTSGSAEVLGHEMPRHRDLVQSRIGYLPGTFAGYGDLTGRRFLRLMGALRGGVDRGQVDLLAERLEVDLTRRLGTLSHGNRQKVGIIQAFMHRPDLLILDEPTNGLDPLMQREFLAMLRETREDGRTVLLSSHVLSEVAAVADTVGILDEGRLLAVRSLDQLRTDAVRRLDLTFTGVVPAERIEGTAGVVDVEVEQSTAHLTVTGSLAELMRAVAPYGLEDVHTHEPDLADVFLSFYRQGGGDSAEHLRQGDVGPAPEPAHLG